jgi:hypothetical protein
MLLELHVVALRKVVAKMGTAAFRPRQTRLQNGIRNSIESQRF